MSTDAQVKLTIKELALDDLDRFYRALDQVRKRSIAPPVSETNQTHACIHAHGTRQALIRFHATKMAEINKIIKELWQARAPRRAAVAPPRVIGGR